MPLHKIIVGFVDMLEAQLGVRKRIMVKEVIATNDLQLWRAYNIGSLYMFIENLKGGYIELSDRAIEYLFDADCALDEIDNAYMTTTDDNSVLIMNELEDIVKANTAE